MSHKAGISEREAWKAVCNAVVKIVKQDNVLSSVQAAELYKIEAISTEMVKQLERGIHTNPHPNPALVIYNPLTRPVSGIIGDAVQLKYTYKGKGYVHDFERLSKVLAIEGPKPMRRRDLLIMSDDEHTPLWADQAEVDAGEIRT